MLIIDSHSHIYLEQFRDDLHDVIVRAKEVGVEQILLPNIDHITIPSLLSVCHEYQGVCFPMMGLHPTSVDDNYLDKLNIVKRELQEHKEQFIAIGEIGIDLYWSSEFKEEQIKVLREQLSWAISYDLPVVIHCRDAFNEVFSVLDEFSKYNIKGVFHSFTGSKEELYKSLSYKNFYIGINGIVTFKNSDLSQLVPLIPMDRLLLETDSPYLSPTPKRGLRNESSFLVYTLAELARIYGVLQEELAEITIKNTKRLFGKLK